MEFEQPPNNTRENIEDPNPDPETMLLEKEALERFFGDILPVKEAEIIYRRFFLEQTLQEVAEAMAGEFKRKNSVHQHQGRALRKLQIQAKSDPDIAQFVARLRDIAENNKRLTGTLDMLTLEDSD